MRRQVTAALVGLALVATACGSRVVPLSASQQPGGQIPGVGPAVGGQTVGPSSVPGSSTGPVPGVSNSPVTHSDCHGGASDKGVYADHIDIGLVAARTGALPGQFEPTVEAVDAYFKMLNAEQGGICNRKVLLHIRDDAGNASNDDRYARELADEVKVFAFVGSVSAPDSDGGVATVSKAERMVDIGFPLTYTRSANPYTYGVPGQLQKNLIGEGGAGIPYLDRANGIRQVAIFWLGEALVSKANAWAFEAVALRASKDVKICYTQETSTQDNSFQNYAIAISGNCKASDGPLAVYSTMENSSNNKLAQAMKDQGVQYKVWSPTLTSYLPSFVRDEKGQPRAANEGAYVSIPQIPFERCAGFDSTGRPKPPCSHPELSRYVSALWRYEPGFHAPGSFGAPGWGMAELFTEAATACGANLTRACIKSALDAMGQYSDHGFLGPTRPGDHVIYGADLLVRVHNGQFVEQPKGDSGGPSSAPDLWDDSKLFDWWRYYCREGGRDRFPSNQRGGIDGFVDNCKGY